MSSTSLAAQLLPALTASIVFRLLKVSFTDLVAGQSDFDLSVVNKATKKPTIFILWNGQEVICSAAMARKLCHSSYYLETNSQTSASTLQQQQKMAAL